MTSTRILKSETLDWLALLPLPFLFVLVKENLAKNGTLSLISNNYSCLYARHDVSIKYTIKFTRYIHLNKFFVRLHGEKYKI